MNLGFAGGGIVTVVTPDPGIRNVGTLLSTVNDIMENAAKRKIRKQRIIVRKKTYFKEGVEWYREAIEPKNLIAFHGFLNQFFEYPVEEEKSIVRKVKVVKGKEDSLVKSALRYTSNIKPRKLSVFQVKPRKEFKFSIKNSLRFRPIDWTKTKRRQLERIAERFQ
ncbi:MAG: hypothetical protein ACREAG_07740 [Nitrosopumilaceae archaeon]